MFQIGREREVFKVHWLPSLAKSAYIKQIRDSVFKQTNKKPSDQHMGNNI